MLEPTLKVDHCYVQRDFDLYLDRVERQPIEVTRDGYPSTVMISLDEYSRLERLNALAARSEGARESIIDPAAAEQPAAKDTPSD